MYRVGLPFWKTAARLGVPVRLRVDVFFDEESPSYWAQSPHLDGLIVSGKDLTELHREAITAASELLALQLNYGPVRAETEMRIRDKAVFAA